MNDRDLAEAVRKAAFVDYEAAQAEARIWGADTCRVLATDLRK